MQKFLHDPAGYGRGYPVIGKLSVQFSYADAVIIDSNGFLDLATTTSQIHGYYCGQGETMSATNQTVEKVCPDYVYSDGVEMVYGADQACTQTDIGTWCDFGTITTGAQQLNLAGSTKAQFFILGFDPDGDGTTTSVVVKCGEPQYIGSSQA